MRLNRNRSKGSNEKREVNMPDSPLYFQPPRAECRLIAVEAEFRRGPAV
jgi:hypothetical protein